MTGIRTKQGSSPTWFAEALAQPADKGIAHVEGADIAYRMWGRPGAPPVILVHGGAAHSHWWTPLAPLLATELLVIALDLSGHGHSDRRTQYSVQRWSAEVLTVARAVSSSPPILVGHSMGGIVAAQTAVEHGAALAAAFMLDAPLWPNAPAPEHPLLIRSGPPRTYPTREAALERFRLVPPQASLCPWYVDHIARHSLSATEDGWTWSFDSAIFDPSGGPGSIERYEGQLEESRCPMVMIMGERSYLVADCTPPSFADIPVIHIPDAGHHLMLDQPVALVSVLRGLLSTYVPTRRSPVRSIRNIGSLDP